MAFGVPSPVAGCIVKYSHVNIGNKYWPLTILESNICDWKYSFTIDVFLACRVLSATMGIAKKLLKKFAILEESCSTISLSVRTFE